jgi:HEAT repeat protein
LRTTVDKHFDALVAVADQGVDPVNRARAVGALGFASTRGPESGIARDILTPLLNALRADDATVVTNAVFALGVLADPRTPVDPLARIIEDPQQPPSSRIGAAWSLLNIQEALHQPQQVQPVWMRLLADPKTNTDPWILIQALRGLGRLRDPALAPVAEPFLQHPTPLVREAAAVALGFLGNRDSHRALLARLSAEETNANVRLAVRKALQALAGQVDRGYDVDQWRRVFESDGRS